MPTVDHGGVALHYEVAGAHGPVVVLTHGLAATAATWRAQVPALSEHFRVVTWDLRSHGTSASPETACSPAVLAGDLAAVARAVGGGEPVHALGHSAGGVITMRFGIDHPELARSLVLVGTASEANAKAHGYYESLAQTAEEKGGAAVVRRLGTRDEAACDPEPRGFARIARAMGSLHQTPITPELAAIRCPVLIIVGEKDFLGVGGSVILSRKIAGARLEIVPERGHPIFREDPDGFNRLVLDFLRAV